MRLYSRSRWVVGSLLQRPRVFRRCRTMLPACCPGHPLEPVSRTDTFWVQRRHSTSGLSPEEERLIADLVQSTAPVAAELSRRARDDVDVTEDTAKLAQPSEAEVDVSENKLASPPSTPAPVSVPTAHLLHPVRRVALFPKQWFCQACQTVNTAPDSQAADGEAATGTVPPPNKFLCSACSSPFPGVHDWICASCRTLNPRGALACVRCATPKPISWTCASCQATNAIDHLVCARCQMPSSTPEPPSDTQVTVRCPRCQALNDAQWDLCTCCLAPMPRYVSGSSSSVPAVTPSGLPSASTVDAAASDDASTGNTEDLAAFVVPAGSWTCVKCNVLQRRNASFCDICLRPREVASHVRTHSSDSESHVDHVTVGDPLAGDWQCPYCRQFRRVTDVACCDHDRQVPEGYWLCRRCCSTNRMDRGACLGCGGQPAVQPWCCAVCTTGNAEGHFSCAACGAAHPLLWQCDACRTVVSATANCCPECGKDRVPLEAPVLCHVCQAPNVPTRRGCFRCRARLSFEEWTCTACQHEDNTDDRCSQCRAPKPYDLTEETWVCELCETAVVSGGDLPVMTQCPFCSAPRPPSGLSYPSRWVCTQCGLFNRTAHGQCHECGTRRTLAPFRTDATCPSCFHHTVLDERERCEHCGESLSAVLSDSLLAVSLEPSPLNELGRLADEQLAAT